MDEGLSLALIPLLLYSLYSVVQVGSGTTFFSVCLYSTDVAEKDTVCLDRLNQRGLVWQSLY